ncbi:sex-determining region Y protein-like [Lineus longissimus]|uniref:sex-determining region Y protein-like n=1 Tax=Lineus longissimus TaxID=88925 RepID=UPI00315C540F
MTRSPAHVKRPSNAFFIFRSQFAKLCGDSIKCQQALSKAAAKQWHSLPRDFKQSFVEMAKREKKQHLIDHPGYRYVPQKKNTTPTRSTTHQTQSKRESPKSKSPRESPTAKSTTVKTNENLHKIILKFSNCGQSLQQVQQAQQDGVLPQIDILDEITKYNVDVCLDHNRKTTCDHHDVLLVPEPQPRHADKPTWKQETSSFITRSPEKYQMYKDANIQTSCALDHLDTWTLTIQVVDTIQSCLWWTLSAGVCNWL